MKILLQNLARKVAEFRKRVDESGRQLNLKREEVAQAERALSEREASVRRLQSALSVSGMGGRGGGGFSPKTSSSQPVNFFQSGGSNQPLFSSQQQPVLGGGSDNIWAGVSSSQGGARRGVGGAILSRPLF